MEICAACCQGCGGCFNACQDSDLALSCALFGGPNCKCCEGSCEDSCLYPRRCYHRCTHCCQPAKKKAKYIKIQSAPREMEMNRSELVF